MADRKDDLGFLVMSPRELPDSVQVAPGHYVSDDQKSEQDLFNEVWTSVPRDLFAVNIKKIIWE